MGASRSAELGHWGRTLEASHIPPEVLELARLQHLAAAGFRRPGATSGDGDPFVLAARTGSALAWLWQSATGTVADLLCATVAADEVAGRYGLHHLLTPSPPVRWTPGRSRPVPASTAPKSTCPNSLPAPPAFPARWVGSAGSG